MKQPNTHKHNAPLKEAEFLFYEGDFINAETTTGIHEQGLWRSEGIGNRWSAVVGISRRM